jgi:DNA-binding protein HU-beta
MTKGELIEEVQKTCKSSELSKKTTGEIVNAVFSTVARAIKKDQRFSYPGFGTWTVRKRAARKGRNPRTGAEIRIKASKNVVFKGAPDLKKNL